MAIVNKNNISLDEICYLITYTLSEDDIGNQIKSPVEEERYCAETPVYSNEFYNANQQGIKIQHVLIMNIFEYANQEYVKYNDNIYKIFKIYKRSDELVELYCCERQGELCVT